MGQYCFARGRLSSSSVVCNAAGRPGARERGVGTLPAGGQAGHRAVGRSARRPPGGRAADTARQANRVTSR